MHEKLKLYYDSILKEYSTGKFQERAIEAREEYFKLAGKIYEDSDLYESKMNKFNDWYVFNYISKSGGPCWKQYFEKNKSKVEKEIVDAFLNISFSVFEFRGKTFRGKYKFIDLIHQKRKVLTSKLELNFLVQKGDVIIARMMPFNEEIYFLGENTLIPKKVRSRVIKEASKVGREEISSQKEIDFILKLEFFYTKLYHYSHLSPEKIFQF